MKTDNQIYYFDIGTGTWVGHFMLRITDWQAFRNDKIGLLNKFLVGMMVLTQKLLGRPQIDSVLEAFPNEGPLGSATNVVRIFKYGITLYLLKEKYVLGEDGSSVYVFARERFGPLPFLFRREKQHPAKIHPQGIASTYYIPLLGADWVCNYQVASDKNHIDAQLICKWAQAQETIHRAI